MLFSSSFEVIKVVVPELCIFFWIPSSVAETAAVIPKGTKVFYAKVRATFINGSANLINNEPENPPDWIILDIWALESFISVDILFSNAFLEPASFLLSIIIHEVNYFH